MLPQLIVMRGLPGSSKTTYAHTYIQDKNPHCTRLNREELRAMLVATTREDDVRYLETEMAVYLLAQGYDVLIDDTNISETSMSLWQHIATKHKAKLVIKDFRDVPLAVCIERDALRAHPVGASTITRMYETYIKGER